MKVDTPGSGHSLGQGSWPRGPVAKLVKAIPSHGKIVGSSPTGASKPRTFYIVPQKENHSDGFFIG